MPVPENPVSEARSSSIVIWITHACDDRHIARLPPLVNFMVEVIMTGSRKPIQRHPTIRILITDDHALMREGVRAILSNFPEWEVCGEAENGQEALDQVRKLKPDLVILDISM